MRPLDYDHFDIFRVAFAESYSLLSTRLIKSSLRNMSLRTGNPDALSQQLFNALADPTRRTIIELLATNGQMTATDIYNNFEITDPAVSQHLKVLREAELVQIEKSAQKHLYSLNPKTMHSLQDWINRTADLWDDRFDKLDGVLDAEKRKGQKKGR